MIREIILIIIIGLVIAFVRSWLKLLKYKPPPQTKPQGEKTRRCAWCGTYVPESGTVSSGGKHYCSIEHKELDKAD